MARLNSICVYCGSALGANPAHAAAAQSLGQAMGEAGIRLVYGGGSVGLMGTVARAALDAGGAVTGIIPRFLQSREKLMDDLSEIVLTEDMHERKMLMFERADAFVALPGGVGTLEEIVEQMTWAQLGRHEKPVLLANIDGFWNPLLALLGQMARERFIRSGMELTYLVAHTAEEILPVLRGAAAVRSQAALAQSAAAEPIARM